MIVYHGSTDVVKEPDVNHSYLSATAVMVIYVIKSMT